MVLLHNATEAVQKQRELNVKSAIIQEVHHRVKNNLQNIAAILRIQARRVESDEARQHLTEAVNRVLSMSVIHEFLSQDEHRPINVKDVCQRIASQVTQVSANPEQEITVQVQRLQHPPAGQPGDAGGHGRQRVDAQRGRAWPERPQHGTIRILLEEADDTVSIQVEDDGRGCPPALTRRITPAAWGCKSFTRW